MPAFFKVPFKGIAGENLAVYAGDGFAAIVNPLNTGVTPLMDPRPATPGGLYNRRYIAAGPNPYPNGSSGGIYSDVLQSEPFATFGGGL